jgi:hypothetical protein
VNRFLPDQDATNAFVKQIPFSEKEKEERRGGYASKLPRQFDYT